MGSEVMNDKRERAIEAATEALVKSSPKSTWRQDAISVIAAYERAMREPAEGEMRVRVCVAVNEWAPGQPGYNAVGWSNASDEALREVAGATRCGVHEPQFRWVEANVLAWQEPEEPVSEGRRA
jgi:hypothetical protein